ncbi:hypothetical protein EYB25_000006 [Talaromyces marneffei]|nr:hypothetical protein EYB25_000006 [Talaromyces marneffei]
MKGLQLFSVFQLTALFTTSRKMIITNGASILNLGPGLRRDVWIFAAISIVTVILRIVSKARMGKFAQDDVLVIFALISNTNQYNNVKSSERTESSAIIALNSATDLYLAIFSAYISWNLKLNFRIKFGLTGLLGLGIFAMIASTIKTVQIQVLVSVDSDPTVATVDLERWLYIETYLVLITLRLQYPVSGH